MITKAVLTLGPAYFATRILMSPMVPLVARILIVWFLVSVPVGILVGRMLRRAQP
ncbi:hypothetical protein BMS3Abin14_01501 [bacterium BMS3Abin14]|nr:hypothetical protein BMS3Abin14_01501 [bacterium BMS3Abin14]